MDIELNTLLVALMFVTILSMGIGSILTALADVLNHATSSRRGGLHVAWIVLMLIVHLNLFWNTRAILQVESWGFAGFLLTIAGPVLLYFCTGVLLTNPSAADDADLRRFFRRLGQRFFLLFAAVQAWSLLIAFALAGRLMGGDYAHVGFLVLALALAAIPNERAQVVGVWLAWLLGLGVLGISWAASGG